MTSRLIPLLFAALLINLILSLARIPITGFQPLVFLYAFLVVVNGILYFSRKRIPPGISAFVILGILFSLLVFGVATLGLLSTKFVVGPMIALYLMVLGHRKAAYASVVIILIYLSLIGIFFVNGFMTPESEPAAYIRSYPAWMMLLLAVASVSIAFLVSFELLHGALKESDERFHLAFENANVGIYLSGLEGRLLKVNDALCAMLGYDHDELEQMNVSEITFPQDRAGSLSYIVEALKGGKEKIDWGKALCSQARRYRVGKRLKFTHPRFSTYPPILYHSHPRHHRAEACGRYPARN